MKNNDNVNQISNYEPDDSTDSINNQLTFNQNANSGLSSMRIRLEELAIERLKLEAQDRENERRCQIDREKVQNERALREQELKNQFEKDERERELARERSKIEREQAEAKMKFELEMKEKEQAEAKMKFALEMKEKEQAEAKMKFELEMKEKQNAAEANQMTHRERLRVIDIKEEQMKEHIKLTREQDEFDRKRIQDANNEVEKDRTQATVSARFTGIGGAGVSVGTAAAIAGVALTWPVGVVVAGVAGIVIGAGSLSGGASAWKTANENIQAKRNEIELINNDLRERQSTVFVALFDNKRASSASDFTEDNSDSSKTASLATDVENSATAVPSTRIS